MEPDTIPLPDIGAFIHHVVADGQTVTDASRARGNRTRSRRSAKRPASAMEQRTGPTSVNESFMWADQYLDSARRSPKGTGSLLKQPCRKASVVSFSCLAAWHQLPGGLAEPLLCLAWLVPQFHPHGRAWLV